MINRVTIEGRLLKDVDIRETQGQMAVAEFSIIAPKRIRPVNGPTDDFFRIRAYGQQALQLEKHGCKGRLISIDGRLESRRFTDREGTNREIVEIVADSVYILDLPAEQRVQPLAS